MVKRYICILLVCALAMGLGGCAQVNKILYPSARTTEFYYDRVDMSREEVKEKKIYDNLFLNDNITGIVAQNAVKNLETRQLISEEPGKLTYAHNVTTDEPLNLWLADCSYQYNFANDSAGTSMLTSLVIKSNRQNSTYYDYLRVMKALTLKYGECTTEMYRSGDATVNPVLVSIDIEDDKILGYYNEQFEEGELYLQSKWVLNNYDVRVFFDSPSECGVVYVFN